MPRYIVEHGFHPSAAACMADGARACQVIGGRHPAGQVTWLQVYVSVDRSKGFCIYDAPSAEAVMSAAISNDLPVREITEVTALDLRNC